MELKDREEKVCVELGDGRKLSSVKEFDLYRGDIEGAASWRGIKVTYQDGSGTFVSIQRLVCRIGDRFGSFVLHSDGCFGRMGSQATWTVVPGSGTGGLQGIRGDGGFVYNAEENSYTLNYHLD